MKTKRIKITSKMPPRIRHTGRSEPLVPVEEVARALGGEIVDRRRGQSPTINASGPSPNTLKSESDEKPPRCATCKMVIEPTRGESVVPGMPGAIVYFHEPEDCIKALREEYVRVVEEAAELYKFVDSVALVEHIVTFDDKETCGYCGCDADEANGPIECHEPHCLQVRARQVLKLIEENRK